MLNNLPKITWQRQDLKLRGLATELISLEKFSERPLLSWGVEGGEGASGEEGGLGGLMLRLKGCQCNAQASLRHAWKVQASTVC